MNYTSEVATYAFQIQTVRCSREAGLELALHAHLRTSEDSHDLIVGSTIWALQRNGKGQEEWYACKVCCRFF